MQAHNLDRVLERDIAWRLAERREQNKQNAKQLGFGQNENPWVRARMADRIGVSEQALMRWEEGCYFPHSLELWMKWCKVLGTTYQDELAAVIAEALAA